MSRLWLGVVHAVVSCLAPWKHTCRGFTPKLRGAGPHQGQQGDLPVFLCRGGPAGARCDGHRGHWEVLRRVRGDHHTLWPRSRPVCPRCCGKQSSLQDGESSPAWGPGRADRRHFSSENEDLTKQSSVKEFAQQKSCIKIP